MKRIRCRLFLLLGLIGGLGLVIYGGWRFSREGQKLRRYVEEQLLPFLGEGIAVQHVRVQWRTMVLEGLEVGSRSSRVALYVPEVRVSYSLYRFLLSGFDPASAARRIVLMSPRFTVAVEADGEAPDDSAPFSLRIPRVQLLIAEGEVYARWRENEVKVAFDLSGWIDGRTRGIGIHLIGTSRLSDGGFTIEGGMDRDTGAYDLGLKGFSLRLSREVWPPEWTRVVPEAGQMAVALHLSRQSGVPRITGEVRIRNGRLSWKEGLAGVDSLDIEARIGDDGVWIQRTTGLFEGHRFEGTGRLGPFSRPTVALDLRWPAVDLSKASHAFPVRGQAGMVVRVQGRLDSLYVQGRLEADRASYKGFEIEGLRAEFTASDSLLRIQRVEGRIGEQGLTGRGWIGIEGEQRGHLSLEVHDVDLYAVLQHLGGDLPRRIGGRGDLVFTMHGGMVRPSWRVDWRGGSMSWDRYRITGALCSVEGQGDRLRISFGSDRIHVNGDVFDPSGRRRVKAAWRFSDLHAGDVLLGGQGTIHGEFPALAITGDLFLDGGRWMGGTVHVNEGSLQWDGGGPRIRAEIGADRFSIGRLVTSWKGWIAADQEGFDFGFRISDFGVPSAIPPSAIQLDGRGKWKELEARLVGENVPLSEMLASIGGTSLTGAMDVQGLVDGVFTLRGPWSALDGSGVLRLTDGRVGAVGGIGGEVTFVMHQGQLGVESGFLQRAEHVLASLEGHGEEVVVTGRDINAEEFFTLFHGRGSAVHGLLNYQMSFSKALHVFKGAFEMVGGALGGMRFDQLEGKVSGDADRGTIAIQFERKGYYRGEMKGDVPLDSRSGDLELAVHIEGPNVLSLAPTLHRAVVQASGPGTVDLGIGGPWSAPRIRRLHIRCTDGVFVPEVLVDRITRLEGELELQPGTDFIQIQRLAGQVEGRLVWATNVDTAGSGAPVTLGTLGLHVGRVSLHTTEQGIDLAVPGIMWPGNRARVELRGREPGDSFYVAGPNDAPTLCGVVVVKSGDVTYPPLSSGSSGRSGEGYDSLLEAIRWDFDVVAGEDVWYVWDKEPMGARTHLRIQEGDRLSFWGSFQEGDFWVQGRVQVDRGSVSYMDSEFEVEQAGMEVDSRYGREPVLYGRARTTTYDDAGAPTDVYLTIGAVDEETGARMEKAPWSRIALEVQSDNPNDDSPGKVLQRLGYAQGEYDRRAIGALTLGVESYFLRPLLTPVERELRKALRLDVVRFRPSIARNLLIRREIGSLAGDMSSDLALFRGSRLTVGDVVSKNWFLFYTGQLEAGLDVYQKGVLGIKHQFGLEYQLWSNTRLQLEYEVDSVLHERDRQIRISHWFPF